MSPLSSLRMIFTMIAFLAVAACEVERPEATVCKGLESGILPDSAHLLASDDVAGTSIAVALDSAIRASRTDPVVLDVLALSSGGQYGAFGAGFLRGWAENAVTPRPEFDLVTGVSAGASFASVPYTGTKYDPLLDVFDGISEQDVFRRASVVTAPFSPSLARPDALEKLLATQLTDEFITDIADRHRVDKARLLISAVNIDTAENRIFNMGEIANADASFAARRDCMVAALLASGAIPGLFPPRNIDGGLYADGGLRDHVFFHQVESERAEAALRTGREIRVNATIVVNGALAPFETPASDTLPGYLVRAAEILADEVLRDSIIEAITFAEERAGWDVRGMIADVDISECGAEAASGTFNGCVTEKLFVHGREVGSLTPIPWKDAQALRDKANEF